MGVKAKKAKGVTIVDETRSGDAAKELMAAVAEDHAAEARRLVAELEAARLRSAAANKNRALEAPAEVARARDEARAEYKRVKAALNQLRIVARGAVVRAQNEAARAAEKDARA